MVEKRKLLILDDDKSICDVLSQGLAKDYEVITTDDPDTAYRLVMKSPPSALLLDIHLKTGNGIDLCQKLRANPITRAIPILIFTGHGTPDKLTRSFDVGADDYIEKPIDLPQLRTRLAARIKRVQELHSQGIAFANLKLFPERYEIELSGEVHRLSEIEFDLLRIFLTNPNKSISRREILKTLWNDTQVTERTVDVHVSSLRRKLKNFDHDIKALYGSGYILRPSAKSATEPS